MASPVASSQLQERPPSFIHPWLAHIASLSRNVLQRLKARSPQLVPLFICLLALPVLFLFSFVAGWIVWRSVPEGWRVPVYLQYGDGIIPYADIEITSLSTTQPYEISLSLTVPATEENYRIGNFMAALTIATSSNETITFVRRPAIVIPPSPSIILRPSRLVHMNVPLTSSLIVGANRVRAHLELGRKDGWRTLGTAEGREVSVYDAHLKGIVHPQGLSRVIAAAPLISSVGAAIVFFSVSTFILAGCVLPSILQSVSELPPEEAEVKNKEPPSLPEAPTSVTRIRRRSSQVKEESDTEENPLSPLVRSGSSSSEIRRRLRQSASHDDE